MQMKKIGSLKINKIFTILAVIAAGMMLGACQVEFTNQEEYQEALANCWMCGFYDAAIDQGGALLFKVYENIHSICVTLLGVFLAIWLAFHSLSIIAVFKNPQPTAFLRKMSGVLLKAVIVSVLLSSIPIFVQVLNLTVLPVFEAFLKTGYDIMAKALNETGSFSSWDPVSIKQQNFQIVSEQNPIFPSGFKEMMRDIIVTMQASLSKGMALGVTVMSDSPIQGSLVGIGIWLLFFCLTLTLPFYLLDGLIRACIALIMLPILLVAWVFPVTSEWLVKGWTIFLSSLIQILVFTLFMSLLVYVFATSGDVITVMKGWGNLDADTMNKMASSIRMLDFGFLSLFALCAYFYMFRTKIFFMANYLGGSVASFVFQQIFQKAKQLAGKMVSMVKAVVK